MIITQKELEAIESDVKSFCEHFSQFRRENMFKADPKEFHKEITLRLEELCVVAKNIEYASSRRAF